MKLVTLLAVAATALLLACSEPETPEPAAVASPAGVPGVPKNPPIPAAPANPLPTVAEPARGPDVRRPETPCDRGEPGWKWSGNVVEDGRCVVGPCDCVRE